MTNSPIILPTALQEGALVRLVAPAGLFDPDKMAAGVEILRDQGFEVTHRSDVLSRHLYMAGDDDRRLVELQEAFDDPEARAIWAIRGGYGTMRLLARLDLSRLIENPKLFVGFSDLTTIHSLLNSAGLATLHGPMVAGLCNSSPDELERLWRIIGHPLPPEPYRFEKHRVIREGSCRGRLLGGNLSLLTRLLGTPYQPKLEGAILLIEDVGEAPYRIDRMLTHLELAGAHRLLAGVVVGEMTDCENENSDPTSMDVLAERLCDWGVPVIAGLSIGHGKTNTPIPLGLVARLDTATGLLHLESPLVEST